MRAHSQRSLTRKPSSSNCVVTMLWATVLPALYL